MAVPWRFTVLLTLAAMATVGSASNPSSAADRSRVTWSAAVTRICANALLFEEEHQLGNRAGAIAVARDIRASTARRVNRIRALPMRPPQRRLSVRWLALEQRLAAVYARSFVAIYDAIAAAESPQQRNELPNVLRRLLDAPDGLREMTTNLERRLRVPDCTGGGTTDHHEQHS
jgi:hypothetical protein